MIADPGYGFLCLKKKGDSGLASGYLNQEIFTTSELVGAAIDFLESLAPDIQGGYIPHHVDLVLPAGYEEYNGEY